VLKKRHVIFACVFILLVGTAINFLTGIDAIESLKLRTSVRIVDRHNRPLFQSRTINGTVQTWTPLQDIPEVFQNLLILSEDKRFHYHPGIDPIATLRALYLNLKHKKVVSGASTITQQLVKIQSGNRKKRLFRKVKESLWAIAFELRYSKDEILEAYINSVYLGHRQAGFPAASLYYFDTPFHALSLSQVSQLICLLRSPYYLDPFRSPRQLTSASNRLLSLAVSKNIIQKEDYDRSQATIVSYNKHATDSAAEHFTRFLLRQIPSHHPVGTIQTTIDLELQNKVARIVNEELKKLLNRNVSNAACLVVDIHTGDVLVYLGSKKFYDIESQGQVDGVQALRQPGSTLKPFAYGLALERGFTTSTVIPDLPINFPGQGGHFLPQNYSQSFSGMVSLRTALANSLNIPALFIVQKVGVESLIERLNDVGLTSLSRPPEHYGLGIVLGNGEVSLWELMHAYLVLAKNGRHTPLVLQKLNHPPETTLVLDERITYLITDILSDNKARELSFGLSSPLSQHFKSAVKTGTSTNYRDNWTIGFTPDYLVGVWVGNFDGSPMRNVSGVTGAGPIWNRVMNEVVGNKKTPFTKPKDIVMRSICTDTHLLAEPHCRATSTEKFTSEMLPSLISCTLQDHDVAEQEKYKKNRNPGSNHIEIVFPHHNTYFAIDPNIDISRQVLSIDYVSQFEVQNVQITVDGVTLNATTWPIKKGRHKIVVKGTIGQNQVNDTVMITVL
jgi:penicillin-binding protein 1C